FELRDQTSGNAPVHYFRASLIYRDREAQLGADKRREEDAKRDKWLATPIKDWPRAEVRADLDRYKPVYSLIERAARCEHCDWDFTDTMREENIGALLPELQRMREFAHLVRLKIRLELAEGRLDGAAAWLRIGFTMARHAGEAPTL